MEDVNSSAGETITKPDAADAGVRASKPIRRCKICLSTIPRPRFRYCSDHCAGKGKVALQAWRRKHASAPPLSGDVDPAST
jgi:hypothetical protein